MTLAAHYYRIRSHFNCNCLGGVWADSEESALAAFHAEMFPATLDVYAERSGLFPTAFGISR